MPKINIGKKYEQIGVYTKVFAEGKIGRKKTYRAVFAVWDGKEWHQQTKRFVDDKDGEKWLVDEQAKLVKQKTKVYFAKGGFSWFVENHYKPYLERKDLKTLEQEYRKLDVMKEFFQDGLVKDIDYLKVMEFTRWILAKPYTREKRTGKTLETISYERTDASAHRYLSRLRHLLKQAIKAQELHALPAFDDAIVQSKEKVCGAIITEQEFFRLLDACEITPKGATQNRHKWRLVLIAAYTMGCRVGELYDIFRRDITSIDTKNRVGVITMGRNKLKNNNQAKEKKVLISTWLYDEMEKEGAFDKQPDERLFMWTKEYRGTIVNDKYSLFNLANVNKDATFKTLRASSATNRDASGQDFDALQAELGHEPQSPVTHKHYIFPQDRQVIDKATPYNDYLERLRSEAVIQAEQAQVQDATSSLN